MWLSTSIRIMCIGLIGELDVNIGTDVHHYYLMHIGDDIAIDFDADADVGLCIVGMDIGFDLDIVADMHSLHRCRYLF